MSSDVMRSLLFTILAGVFILTFLRFKYNKEIFIYSMMVLLVLDLSLVGKRYLHDENFIRKQAKSVPFPMTAADQAILSDTSQSFRVLNLAVNTFNDASTSYYHQSIGGYHGAKMKRYKELIDYNLLPELSALRNGLQKPGEGLDSVLNGQHVMNMLNTRYFIYNPEANPLRNLSALGNAWFVNDYKIVPDADAEILALADFNPSATAIIDKRYESQVAGFNHQLDTTASIHLTEYKPNHLTYTYNSSVEQLTVFSEIHYDKGWNVYVDNTPAEYFRVNYVLRGMKLPAGSHEIEWKFEPEIVVIGEKIAFAGSSLLLICFIVLLWLDRNTRKVL